MERKVSKLKSTINNLKIKKSSTRKTTKNSSARTPKHLSSIFDQKSIHFSKFKTVHGKIERQIAQSVIPQSTNLFNQTQSYNANKIYRTNQTQFDFPHTQSQKVINTVKNDEKTRQNNKSIKTCKKNQQKKVGKFELGHIESSKQYLTTRKSSIKKDNLKNILHRTQKILQNYQKREQQWNKQRQTLIQQVSQLRKKDTYKKCITHSASAYNNTNKKYLY